MSNLEWLGVPPPPGGVLLVACSGWNDAGQAASSAVEWVRRPHQSQRLARLDPDAFFDYQAHRPIIEINAGTLSSFQWPGGTFHTVTGPAVPLVTYTGDEPSHRWRALADEIIDLIGRCGIERVITFGALASDVPHTRVPPLTLMATDPELAERIPGNRVTYHGPTGFIGTLHVACAKADVAAVSLWAPVPHYLSGTAQPLATMALLEGFAIASGIAVDMTGLDTLAAAWRRQADELVADDPEAQEIVESLETQYDAGDPPPAFSGDDVPSGESIAAELEAFLRENDER